MERRRRVFLSVGRQGDERQRTFVAQVRLLVERSGFDLVTIPSTFENPLNVVIDEINKCDAAIIVCFERIYAANAQQFRSSEKPEKIDKLRSTTIWNHVEAAISKCAGIPTLIIAENGCRQDGMLDPVVQFRICWVDLDTDRLQDADFLHVYNGWVASVLARTETKRRRTIDDLAHLSALDVIKAMTFSQWIWLSTAVASVFGAGITFGRFLRWP
jgi:hypothetical protein